MPTRDSRRHAHSYRVRARFRDVVILLSVVRVCLSGGDYRRVRRGKYRFLPRNVSSTSKKKRSRQTGRSSVITDCRRTVCTRSGGASLCGVANVASSDSAEPDERKFDSDGLFFYGNEKYIFSILWFFFFFIPNKIIFEKKIVVVRCVWDSIFSTPCGFTVWVVFIFFLSVRNGET